MKPKSLLTLFFILVLISLTEPLVASMFSTSALKYVFLSLKLLAIPVLFMAINKHAAAFEPPLQTQAYNIKLKLFWVVMFILTAAGIVRNNDINDIVLDIIIFLILYAFLVLGKYDETWLNMQKFLIVCFWLSFILTLAGLFYRRPEAFFGEVVFEELDTRKERWGVLTAGYRMSGILNLWPLLFTLAYSKSKMDKWKFFGLLTAVAYLGLQIFFQKRAPTLRAIAYVSIAVVFIPLIQKKLKLGTIFVVIIGLLGLAYFAASSESMLKLKERFSDMDSVIHNERTHEIYVMFSDLWPMDIIIGRGMGGYYVNNELDTLTMYRVVNNQLVRTAVHMGIFQPILKGGVLLWLFFASLVFPMFYRKPPGWYANPLNAAAMVILPVYLLFLIIEGSPSFGNIFDAVLVGFACSRLGILATETNYYETLPYPISDYNLEYEYIVH